MAFDANDPETVRALSEALARALRYIEKNDSQRLALQLHIFSISESMGHDDSEIMDDRGIDRDDA